MNNEFKQHFDALLKARNELAQVVTTEGAEILTAKMAADTAHKSDCPCKAEAKGECTDTSFKETLGKLEDRIKVQKAKRAEIEEYDDLLMNVEAIEAKAEETVGKRGAVTPNATDILGSLNLNKGPLYPSKSEKFGNRIGNDFFAMVQKMNIGKGDIKGRSVIGTSMTKSGDTFNRVASLHCSFGKTEKDLQESTRIIADEMGIWNNEFETTLKTRRTAMKSMFTQSPLAGGDGSLFAPTEVFAGNTGGLCEYIVDNEVDVLPYAPAPFLECIPVRQIPKSYVLYARQTLRVNNASGIGEAAVTDAGPGEVGAVDFRPLKPESQFGFTQLKAYTITYADTLAVSEEFLEDCPTIADAVETQLMENVRQEFYDQIINGDGSDGEFPEIVGLLAQVGLSTRIYRGAASFFGNTMTSGAADDNIRETIIRSIFDAEAYGYTVDCVLMSHDDYVKMYFYKDELGRPLYTEAELGTIRGAVVRADVRMPQGTALVGAFRQVVQMLIRRSIRLDIGWIDKQFRQDMLTLRATMRGGLLVKAPHALTRITGLV